MQALRKEFPNDQTVFVPLATTYEGTFHMPGWRKLASELNWKETTLETLLQLTARSIVMRLHEFAGTRVAAFEKLRDNGMLDPNGNNATPLPVWLNQDLSKPAIKQGYKNQNNQGKNQQTRALEQQTLLPKQRTKPT